MRNIRDQSITGLIVFLLFNTAYAKDAPKTDLIYGFNKVSVGQDLKTLVEFDQEDFKRFQKNDALKLQVKDGNTVIREDAISNNGKEWIWNKVLPFSEDLKFVILKEGKAVSNEYLADTKSDLQFSENEKALPIVKGLHFLPAKAVTATEKNRLPIDANGFKDCQDKVLVVVFDKASNTFLWQGYDVLKNLPETGEIELSKDMQPTVAIVTDDSSCGN